MPVHSLIVTNTEGCIVFSRRFDSSYSAEFEKLLKTQVGDYSSVSSLKRSVLIGNVVSVVFKKYSDLIIFIGGTDEIDEPILAQLLETVWDLLDATLEGKASEQLLHSFEYNAKFAIAVDEMMPQGIIECLDTELILKLSKLKSI
mmetsp:Transcript_30504/g.43749  ORF Transcript_30504/g.43749 Transcript_30504/m.43749 type:complete len:145 (-) Transcript_30504:309-743(-)|eukprot:CAMPEP_0170061628 /NCGR_PEP_ID=MMETSP0019_2-20121128/3126_1 /TAXON_ID=98059 /ORGANISM="Dinobryon sp., Strain UTEXLB2267" /LENGTH=144 /DNA_ID=CAMNT_0010267509 /DNA_START=8 /DNA_END=442 /DNA_ORIENTATION=-